jgi:hypothetical protein
MHELIAAFAGFPLFFQDAIHGPSGAIVVTFVQQGGLHGRRRTILKSLFMQDGQHAGAFVRAEGARGSGPIRG